MVTYRDSTLGYAPKLLELRNQIEQNMRGKSLTSYRDLQKEVDAELDSELSVGRVRTQIMNKLLDVYDMGKELKEKNQISVTDAAEQSMESKGTESKGLMSKAEEPTASLSKQSEEISSTNVQDFISWLADKESKGAGGYRAENSEGYVGLLQFGQDRLDDFNNANGTEFTLKQFKNSNSIQDRVNKWHIRDIDKVYVSLEDPKVSLNAFRAMAHLGGIGGAKKHLATNGAYDPADSNGTRLSDYGIAAGGYNLG